MMLPSAPPRGRGPLAATLLTQAGVWLLVVGRLVAAGPVLLATSAVLVGAGVTLFLAQVGWMLRNLRPPPTAQPRPDPGVAHALLALSWLAVSTAIGVWLAMAPASERALAGAMAYGVLALVGFLAQMVVGVTARLLPLYAWLWGFHDRGHRDPPPSMHSALSRPAQIAGLALWSAGVPALALGLAGDRLPWITAGASGLALAVLLGGANLVLGIRRLWSLDQR
jgi:hypothetical protein